jgi:cell division protease FtsH
LSNPLDRGREVPEVEIDPTGDLPGVDLGTMDDVEDWIQNLIRDDKTERRYSSNRMSNRISPDRIKIEREELFRTGSKFLPVKREEIVGVDNILIQIDEIVDWLINYKDYTRFSARPEPGIIFEGPPGTGKTYTSRYMATAANALFVDVRDFPYAGKTLVAPDIKDMFDLARATHKKTNRPIILFWDEFEGTATERSNTASPEQKAAVSQITAELDGINGKPTGVLLVGCTNYGNDIDEALKRPGRMGMHVEFNAPSRFGKSKLLQFYLSRVKTKGDIDFDTGSYFFDDSDTAASVEEAVQEAWRFAVHRWILEGRPRRGPLLTQGDLLEIFLKRLVGPPPAYSDVTPETLYQVAIHEIGHAVAAHLLGVGLRLVTIRPGKEHLGKTMTYLRDPRTATIEELEAHLAVGVAGFVVEDIVGIPRGADASGDTTAVTSMASDMVDNQGFGKRSGFLNLRVFTKRFYNASVASDRTLEEADLDTRELVDHAERESRRILTDFGVDKIKTLANRLIEVQTMTGKDFAKEVQKLGV